MSAKETSNGDVVWMYSTKATVGDTDYVGDITIKADEIKKVEPRVTDKNH